MAEEAQLPGCFSRLRGSRAPQLKHSVEVVLGVLAFIKQVPLTPIELILSI